MPTDTREEAFETTLEQHLLNQHGYYPGQPIDFDREYALDTAHFWAFLEETQATELTKLKRHTNWREVILTRYDRLVKKHGILKVLRGGLQVEDAHLEVFYQDADRFASNRWSVTRQLRYHRTKRGQEIDTVLLLNGIPLVTLELKIITKGQTATVQGRRQLERDRDAREPLLQFGRCLVHMVADTEVVWMTTRLNGKDTYFLPFNMGSDRHGAGNPVNPGGHRTAYLWEDVFAPTSLAEIIQHYALFEKEKKNDPLRKQTLIFPRYHQRDAVRELLADSSRQGPGQTYLVQHSAGSGKSHTITWLAYQLIALAGPRPGRPLFDTVLVITDRRLLDKQLRDNIQQFGQVGKLVKWAKHSNDLRLAMQGGTRIVITTLQKFPFVVDAIEDLGDRRFAVLIDEAHSSQSGTAADAVNTAMGVAADKDMGADAGAHVVGEEQDDPDNKQETINRVMDGRKMRATASYYAFTATPKATTQERFGTEQPDGSFRPFHLYSMKQAIEEGFIMDVLRNYTTYQSYYEIIKSVEDNPEYDVAKAQARLKAYVERDPNTIAEKARVMVDHFLERIVRTNKLRGKAKAMVITQNIPAAIYYYRAVRQELAKRKADSLGVLVAFSGEKEVGGVPYTEAGLNGFPESDTRDKFDTDEYRILVVANKYLTGFDQRKLTAMYVDKKLQGVLAVQALSRLNRANNKLGKRSEDVFVLDFYNTTAEITLAFDDYYTSTSLSGPTDVSVLHDLTDTLLGYNVFTYAEAIALTDDYLSGVPMEELSPAIASAADRFNLELELADEEKADFKIKAKQFVKIYGQMASIMAFNVEQWERMYWMLKFLIPHLVVPNALVGIDDILESVDLSTYGLRRTQVDAYLQLDEAENTVDPQNPNERGAYGESDTDELDNIVTTFNERYFGELDGEEADMHTIILDLIKNLPETPGFAEKVAGSTDSVNADLAFEKMVASLISRNRSQHVDFYRQFVKDDAFRSDLLSVLGRAVR